MIPGLGTKISPTCFGFVTENNNNYYNNIPYDAGNSNPVLCDNLKEWDGVGVGRETQEEGDMCIPMADSCGCMAGTNTTL